MKTTPPRGRGQPAKEPAQIALQTVKPKVYLVQYNHDGTWYTIAKRSKFKAACVKARSEYRAMKGRFITAVIGVSDLDAPILRRTMENNFTL